MISLKDAAASGIARVRKPIWVNPAEYLLIDIIDGAPGPWVHLYSPINESVCQQKNPQDILWVIVTDAGDEKIYEPYHGDPDPDEAKRAEKRSGA